MFPQLDYLLVVVSVDGVTVDTTVHLLFHFVDFVFALLNVVLEAVRRFCWVVILF